VQRIALELDSGDILLQESFPLTQHESADDLAERSALMGAEMIRKVLAKIEQGKVQSKPQDPDMATYCRRMRKEDGHINWRLPAAMIERMVRAYNPWPKAYSYWNGTQLSILKSCVRLTGNDIGDPGIDTAKSRPGEVLGVDRKNGILIQTGEGLLCAEQLQLQGKKVLFWKDFLNGNRDLIGSQLGDD